MACSGHCFRKEVEAISDGLWAWGQEAQAVYQSEVVSGGKPYCLYVKNVVKRLWHASADADDDEALWRAVDFADLLRRQPMQVEDCFSRPNFCREDFEELYLDYKGLIFRAGSPRLMAKFSPAQLALLAAFIREREMFVEAVDEQTLDLFFRCKLTKPLVATTLRPVLELLEALSKQGVISSNWIDLAGRHKLLATVRTMEACTTSSIYKNTHIARTASDIFLGKAYASLIEALKTAE